jgi:hypothetical protein
MLCPLVILNTPLCFPQLIMGLFPILGQRLQQNASVVTVLFVMVFFRKVEMVEICGVWMKKQ